MKIAFLILLLVWQSIQISLDLSKFCICQQYKLQRDCLDNTTCKWTENTCSSIQSDKQMQKKTFCNQLSSESCNLTLGCAYYNNSCVPFSGCSAYFKQTSGDCQLISKQCISDQIKCIDVKPCAEYDQKDCSFFSSSGTTICVWEDNACRDQICTDAPKVYSNDVQCNKWLKGCITNGKGCILPPLLTCDQYTKLSVSSNTEALCEGYLGDEGPCTLDVESKVCRLMICEDYRGSSDEECNGFKQGCVTIGRKCASQKKLCSEYSGFDCYNFVGSDGKCFKDGLDEGPCELRRCEKASSSEVKSDLDCENYQSGCKYTGQGCVSVSDIKECSSYTDTKESCEKQQGSDGYCERDNETIGQCKAKVCSNAPNSYKTHSQCKEYQIGCTSNGNGCITQSTCLNAINSIGCSGIKSCEWNEYCLQEVQCSDFTNEINCLSDWTFFGVPKLYCKWKGNACSKLTCKDAILEEYTDSKCTNYLKGCISNGFECLEENLPCDYFTGTQSQCAQFIASICWNDDNATSQSKCRFRQCIDDRVSKTDADCQSFLDGCKTNMKGCVPSSSPCNVYSGTAEICQQFKNGICWNTSNANLDTPCIEKKCTDDITSKTDSDCETFHSGCVTNLKGCISKEVDCSFYRGSQKICSQFKGKNGTVTCWQIDDVSENTSCIDKTCNLDTKSINDQQCKDFLAGCLFTGTKGCISSLEPCSSYQGDLKTCQNFIGNGFKCWNDPLATAKTPCTQRTCADDLTSTTDPLCEASQHGCVTNGTGCIEAAQLCEAYQGTQKQCEKFKGANGTIPCWNSQNLTSTPCQVRKCTDSPATKSNEECESFLKGCVTNGQGCIDQQQTCSYFSKLYNDCSLYIATDGPCKNSNDSDQCTPKVCSEAINTTYNQEFCKAYHPSCISISTGCVKQAPDCNNIQANLACALNTGCTWINNCRYIITDCQSQTKCSSTTTDISKTSTATICEQSTNQLKEYNWRSGTCSIRSCENLSVDFTTHQQCQILSYCTTTGQGCIVMGSCSSYKNIQTCSVAKTTETEGICNWNSVTKTCQVRKCQDSGNNYDVDTKCESFLTGCRSNGISCISPGFDCSELKTAEACIKDSYEQPCLFVEGICYNYTKCTDIVRKTHQECQQFSNQCTTDGEQCIPMARCEDYTTQLSCVIGTDSECGWNPKQGIKNAFCSQLGACPTITKEDDQSICAEYNQKCISDGQNCIEKAKCSEYLTKTACQQNGIDGVCFFDKEICRLSICEDSQSFDIKSYEECSNFLKGIQCTTNKTMCVPLKQCSQYVQAEECELGTDGQCFYYTESNDKSICRIKTCEDSKYYDDESCKTMAYPIGKCVYDGTQCTLKKSCHEYTTEKSCHVGGTDGQCTFNSNICSLMSKCEDAYMDEIGCNKEYCNYDSKPTDYGSFTQTSCTPHTCSTKFKYQQKCLSVTSFDNKYITPCNQREDSYCSEVTPEELEYNNCNQITYNLYYWNIGTKDKNDTIITSPKCEVCVPGIINSQDPTVTTASWGGIILAIQFIFIINCG